MKNFFYLIILFGLSFSLNAHFTKEDFINIYENYCQENKSTAIQRVEYLDARRSHKDITKETLIFCSQEISAILTGKFGFSDEEATEKEIYTCIQAVMRTALLSLGTYQAFSNLYLIGQNVEENIKKYPQHFHVIYLWHKEAQIKAVKDFDLLIQSKGEKFIDILNKYQSQKAEYEALIIFLKGKVRILKSKGLNDLESFKEDLKEISACENKIKSIEDDLSFLSVIQDVYEENNFTQAFIPRLKNLLLADASLPLHFLEDIKEKVKLYKPVLRKEFKKTLYSSVARTLRFLWKKEETKIKKDAKKNDKISTDETVNYSLYTELTKFNNLTLNLNEISTN